MKNVNKLTDKELMEQAILFSLKHAPRESDGLTISEEGFQKTKATFLFCVKYLRDNYKANFSSGYVEGYDNEEYLNK